MTISTESPQAPFLSSTIAPSEPTAQAINHNDSLVQISSTLGGIILFILAGAWLVKKLGFAPRKFSKNPIVNIKSSCSLGNKERVVVVEVNHQYLVLGVTAQTVNVLHQYPAPQDTIFDSTIEPLTFQSLLKKKQDAAKQAASVVPIYK
ncbi:flagellar biosynthetic protein FliO [Providencia heimbachae]|uniref:Flagellar protein n=1 Tax=Providencia heimbachae ATCC 35613 TaxID=1354272 RepID=A0A1B7K196_9GAMM|nr:flagellar biosynthetic protein FliO [Providencia heimbachae]MDD9338199.1 flagellar biosynthetic protein FliO [Providencia heimbachae]OAT53923.1 FliO family flagellar biosynthesis protein [Providencia heimbachae ATCC 35613]SQH13826.1 Flagellar protein fliO [Providencia heimbachae]